MFFTGLKIQDIYKLVCGQKGTRLELAVTAIMQQVITNLFNAIEKKEVKIL